jgi:hypothetical protein
VIALSDCQLGMDPQSHTGGLRLVEEVLGRMMTSNDILMATERPDAVCATPVLTADAGRG